MQREEVMFTDEYTIFKKFQMQDNFMTGKVLNEYRQIANLVTNGSTRQTQKSAWRIKSYADIRKMGGAKCILVRLEYT